MNTRSSQLIRAVFLMVLSVMCIGFSGCAMVSTKQDLTVSYNGTTFVYPNGVLIEDSRALARDVGASVYNRTDDDLFLEIASYLVVKKDFATGKLVPVVLRPGESHNVAMCLNASQLPVRMFSGTDPMHAEKSVVKMLYFTQYNFTQPGYIASWQVTKRNQSQGDYDMTQAN